MVFWWYSWRYFEYSEVITQYHVYHVYITLCVNLKLCSTWKGTSGTKTHHLKISPPPFVYLFKWLLFPHFPESPEESSADQESEDDLSASRTSLERQTPHRGNTTVHVCWHRNTSVSMVDFSVALEVPQRSIPLQSSPAPSLCLCLTFLSFSPPPPPRGTSSVFKASLVIGPTRNLCTIWLFHTFKSGIKWSREVYWWLKH